jgi:hypothetical protein
VGRRALRVAALLALLVCLALAAAPGVGAADPFTYRDAGCTQAEDPVDLRFLDVRIAVPAPGGPVVLDGAAAARWIVHRLAFQQPFGAGSSDSWFRFPDGACVDQTAWVTDHGLIAPGSHVRFWQDGADWRDVAGAAHHEFLCFPGLPRIADHHVDDFVGARDAAARPFVFLNTIGQGVVFTFSWQAVRPPGLLTTSCDGGDPLLLPDDGMVLEIRQVVPLVSVPFA